MIKAAIFDIDNTIIDFLEMKKKSLGPAVDAMIAKGLKMSRKDALAKIYELYRRYGMEYKLIFQEFLKSVGQSDSKILAAGIIGYRSKREVKPYPGMFEVLHELKKRGLKLAIVSDAPNLKAWMRLTYMGIEDMFDVVVAFDDTNTAKPAKLPFEKAVAELGVNRQDVLMIGDMPEKDVVGAKAMGFVSCFAKYGNSDVKKGESGADFEAEKPEDILGIVSRINAGH
ncbi:HAD-IA family hydrolase [Candidatus Woesearchaeota archaeon]|nr:HAD-IA family hydrolase [Candidatus Woesearchaeota archaeon]